MAKTRPAPTPKEGKAGRASVGPHKTRQSPRLAQRATKSPEPEQSPTRGSPTKASASARGRGRPRKEDSPAKIPAKRGRPPKNAPYKDTGEEGDETSEEEQPDSRRSPGKASAKRNKKATAEDDLDVHPTVEAHSPVRRSPGKSPAKPAHRVTKGTRSVSPVKATRASPAKSSAPTRRSPSKSPAKTTRGARSVSPVKATRRSPSKSSGKKAAHPAEDEDVEMMDVDELALASPKRAAAGYKTTSPGKSHQSPKSKQATWQQREKSPAKSPAKTAKASTKADKEKATAAVPAPPSAARGPIESSTNPENLPDGGKNPFHHTMPGPEVWHRRQAGEDKAAGDSAASQQGVIANAIGAVAKKFSGAKKSKDKTIKYPSAWKVPSAGHGRTIAISAVDKAKKAYFSGPPGNAAASGKKRKRAGGG